MNPPRQIFGRHPVVIVAAIQAILNLAVSFHLMKAIGLNGADDVALVAGVLNGLAAVYLALGTTETLLAPCIELFKAGAAFAAIYGLNLTGEQAGLAVTTITAVFAMLHMPNTSPQATLGLSGPVLLAPETATPAYNVSITNPGSVAAELDTGQPGQQGAISLAAALIVAAVIIAVTVLIVAGGGIRIG